MLTTSTLSASPATVLAMSPQTEVEATILMVPSAAWSLDPPSEQAASPRVSVSTPAIDATVFFMLTKLFSLVTVVNCFWFAQFRLWFSVPLGLFSLVWSRLACILARGRRVGSLLCFRRGCFGAPRGARFCS